MWLASSFVRMLSIHCYADKCSAAAHRSFREPLRRRMNQRRQTRGGEDEDVKERIEKHEVLRLTMMVMMAVALVVLVGTIRVRFLLWQPFFRSSAPRSLC